MGTVPCPGMVHSELPGHRLCARPCARHWGNRQQGTAPVTAQVPALRNAPSSERKREKNKKMHYNETYL